MQTLHLVNVPSGFSVFRSAISSSCVSSQSESSWTWWGRYGRRRATSFRAVLKYWKTRSSRMTPELMMELWGDSWLAVCSETDHWLGSVLTGLVTNMVSKKAGVSAEATFGSVYWNWISELSVGLSLNQNTQTFFFSPHCSSFTPVTKLGPL